MSWLLSTLISHCLLSISAQSSIKEASTWSQPPVSHTTLSLPSTKPPISRTEYNANSTLISRQWCNQGQLLSSGTDHNNPLGWTMWPDRYLPQWSRVSNNTTCAPLYWVKDIPTHGNKRIVTTALFIRIKVLAAHFFVLLSLSGSRAHKKRTGKNQ